MSYRHYEPDSGTEQIGRARASAPVLDGIPTAEQPAEWAGTSHPKKGSQFSPPESEPTFAVVPSSPRQFSPPNYLPLIHLSLQVPYIFPEQNPKVVLSIILFFASPIYRMVLFSLPNFLKSSTEGRSFYTNPLCSCLTFQLLCMPTHLTLLTNNITRTV